MRAFLPSYRGGKSWSKDRGGHCGLTTCQFWGWTFLEPRSTTRDTEMILEAAACWVRTRFVPDRGDWRGYESRTQNLGMGHGPVREGIPNFLAIV
jgi:hypothetical protein